MTKRSFSIALILAALMALPVLADVSGKWTGELSGPDGNGGFTLAFTFKQDGNKLTGTVQGPQGDPIAISDGKVDGDKLSFTVKIEANGGMTITHDGVINGDEIKLSTKSDGGNFPDRPILLKRAK